MKKIIIVLLALMMCLSLCACGSNSSENVPNSENTPDIKDVVIGTWKCYYELTEDTPFNRAGDTYSLTIELYKGGTGIIYWHDETNNEERSGYSLTWEIAEDIVNISYGALGTNVYVGLEYDFETDTLTEVDLGRVFDRY